MKNEKNTVISLIATIVLILIIYCCLGGNAEAATIYICTEEESKNYCSIMIQEESTTVVDGEEVKVVSWLGFCPKSMKFFEENYNYITTFAAEKIRMGENCMYLTIVTSILKKTHRAFIMYI